MLQGDTDFKASFIHNLDAHIRGRLPRIGSEVGTGALNDFRNNVIYNWFSGAGYSGGGQYSKNNFIHNFYLAGQGGDKGWNSTQSGGTGIFSGSNGFTFAFVQGNLKDINKDGDANDAVSADSSFTSTTFQEAAYDIDVGVTLDAEDAFINVLRYAGSRWWDRDYDVTLGNTSAIDTVSERIMHDVIAGTGRINAWSDDPWNDDPAEGAEWRSLWALRPAPDGTAPYNHPAGWDADRDGIPGWWELSHGLNPDAANNNGDFDLDGYTDLEEYLHEVAAWPAPGEIHFTGEQSGRFAEIQNWRVFGLDLNIAGSGIVTTSTYWQPSRYDTAVVNNRTVVVDAAGQNAGTLRLQDGAGLSIGDGGLKGSNLEVGDGCSVTVGEGATLRLAGDGAITLGAGATFINNGIVDLISWQGSLPQGFVNNGTIIDRRDVLLISVVAAASRQVELTILAQPGHVYQLESKPSLTAGDWEAAGDAISGTGQPVVLVLPDTDLLQSRFYRVSIR